MERKIYFYDDTFYMIKSKNGKPGFDFVRKSDGWIAIKNTGVFGHLVSRGHHNINYYGRYRTNKRIGKVILIKK